MTLPALAPTANSRVNAERTNALIRNFNRADQFVPIYAADSGSATAYAIAPVPGITKQSYVVGQIFYFKALNTSTSTAPTFNVNGLGAGTITYPDGSALVPGDIAANGFYAVQVTATSPAAFVLLTMPVRRVLQRVSTETGAVATGTATIPFDDTKPDQSVPEGDQVMSLSITRKSAVSTLYITVTVNGANSAAGTNLLTAALFQDSTALAIATGWQIQQANVPASISFLHQMPSGGTGSTTFKVRLGCNAAGTTTFNGQLGGRIYAGALASSISIEEVL